MRDDKQADARVLAELRRLAAKLRAERAQEQLRRQCQRGLQ